MPVLSRFYGLVVFMDYREHNPPHFHARYQGFELSVEIEPGVVTGHIGDSRTETGLRMG